MPAAVSSPQFPPLESHFRDLVAQMDSVFWVVTLDAELVYVSPAFETIWDRPSASVLGPLDAFLETVHPEDRERVSAWVSRGLEEREPQAAHYRIRRPDGTTRWVHTRAFPLRDRQGRVQRFAGLTDDITETRQTRRELTETARRLQQTFASLPDAVFIVSARTRTIVECNPAAERIFGYTRDEFIGSGTRMLHVNQESYEAFSRDYDPDLERDGVVWVDWTMRRKDGTTFESRHTVRVLQPEEGLESGVVSVVRDISRERQLERRLQQTEKLEAVGRLSAGISHDFNNVLTVIRAHTEMVRDALPETSSLRTDLGEVLSEVCRAHELTRRLLAFGRRQALDLRVLDLAEEVGAMQPTLRRLIPAHIDLRLELADGPASRVEADPGQLHQVVLNLMTNAVQAVSGKGDITLRVAPYALSAEEAGALPWEARPGAYVSLTVEDTGVGMSPEVRERIFEPFFTTKPPGEGTGLGLASVFGIVKQSGGHITVDSEPGRGTRMRVLFPGTLDAPASAEEGEGERREEEDGKAAEREEGAGRSTLRVLVAEDSVAVGEVARRILERAGHAVEVAMDFPGALARVRDGVADLDLLVSDAVMPGMTGAEFLARVRELAPDLPIVLMSGYSRDELKGGIRDRADTFLEKPFSPDSFMEAVDEALEG